MNIINVGLVHRKKICETIRCAYNRTHTILHIDVYQTRRSFANTNDHNMLGLESLKGRLVLVDLAGSDRIDKATSRTKQIEEAKHIN